MEWAPAPQRKYDNDKHFSQLELQLELRHVSLEIILQENYAAMLMKTLMLTLSRCKKQELVWFLIYFTLSICTILSTLLVVGSRLVGSADPGDPVPLVVAVPLTTLPAVTDDAAPVAGPVAILLVGTASLLSPSHVLVTGNYYYYTSPYRSRRLEDIYFDIEIKWISVCQIFTVALTLNSRRFLTNCYRWSRMFKFNINNGFVAINLRSTWFSTRLK